MNELTINFNDITINETDGDLDEIKVLMDPGNDLELWLLKSDFGIVGEGHDCFGQLEFWHNGEAVLTAYMTNYEGEIIPTDLLFLNMWVKERGWEFLIDYELRMYNFDFWARFDSMVEGDEESNFEYDDDIDDDMDFVEYQENLRNARKPKMKNVKMTDLKEFEDHKRDQIKRDENESKRIF
jgi:hypothetical protein